MEKKKLLLISVSTGVFLMLVIGASILIFTPPSFSSRPTADVVVIPPGKPADGPVSRPDVTKPAGEQTEATVKNSVPQVSIIEEPAKPPVVNIEISAVGNTGTPPVVETPKPAPKPVAKPVASPKPAVAPKPKSGAAYWVQIGSYTQKSSADRARASLSERGLVSVIFDGDVQGKIYYRVRVGPYVSQAEADYWLRFVKDIDGFENSQVWKSGA
ncbi:MAG: SPOR domain-containing protein [Spirochaetaceae bacterium]|jgi:DedD protein|nr:SPOR domain-containing protein [Spirochaetaceae bacterium]